MFPSSVMTLVNESATVPGPSAAGDDRIVLVVLGANGTFTEEGGLTYGLTSDSVDTSGALTVRFGDEVLSECDATPIAPCFEAGAGETIVHVLGSGTVELEDGASQVSTLVLEGGSGSYELHIRR
jgi:hypothetical protein